MTHRWKPSLASGTDAGRDLPVPQLLVLIGPGLLFEGDQVSSSQQD